MSRFGKIARRTLLFGSAALAGGVAFGAYLARRPIPNPLLADLGEDEAALTPFIKITPDGITLITPRADVGQGAYSTQAYLIAEELDIDPSQATITPGLPDAAYYNGTVLGEGVPFPGYETSGMAETARAFMSVPAKLFEVQITGGSSTVPDMYDTLRRAGAVARETLKEAAAQRSGHARADLTTQDGHVVLPDGTRLAYEALARAAAQIDPVEDVALRPPEQWRFLGKPDLPRTDMIAKCTGTEVYGIDIVMDGMLFASVQANPAIGQPILDFDAAEAAAMPGVEQIVPMESGVGVIATNTWYAIEAARAITCTWAPAPYPGTSEGIWAALEASIDTQAAYDHRQRDAGDVEAALEDGDVLTAEYRAPYLAHAPLEPMNAVVRITDDLCEIWTGTQIPLFVRNRAAQITGLDRDQVRVYVQPMGGSFGHRLEMTHVEQAVLLAMEVPGRPVKLTWSREEDMAHDYPRPAALARGRGKVTAGKVDAFDLSVSQSAMTPGWIERLSGYSLPGPDPTITTGSWDQPFAIPHYRVTGYRAPDMVPTSSWRAVGASTNGFFHDTFLDELIHAAGADPLEERIRLCLDDTSRKVLEAVGEISGWAGATLSGGRGRGVAFCHAFGVPVAEVIDVTMTEDGLRMDQAFIVADVGRVLDPTNLEAQLSGGLLFGLSHAILNELTYADHRPDQSNFHDYEALRLYQAPEITVKVLENGRMRGAGEVGLPPAAPALGNAIFAATGQRLREMPFSKHIDFL